jgi:ribosomal-protein-alanine N-acetyltransferase
MPFIIETAQIRHLDRLYEIEKECFETEAFTKQQIAGLLTDYNSISLVAKENNNIVGFIIGSVRFEKNALTGHILTVDVSPTCRKKGVGARLLREMENLFEEGGVKACHLEVREDNVAALSLYQKLGFEKVATLKNYYGEIHGVYLRKALT